jgi:hypothetical protein
MILSWQFGQTSVSYRLASAFKSTHKGQIQAETFKFMPAFIHKLSCVVVATKKGNLPSQDRGRCHQESNQTSSMERQALASSVSYSVIMSLLTLPGNCPLCIRITYVYGPWVHRMVILRQRPSHSRWGRR